MLTHHLSGFSSLSSWGFTSQKWGMMTTGVFSATVNVIMSKALSPFVVGLICLTLAIRALRNYPRRIKNYAEARSVRGVGEKTARKVIQFSD